MHIRHWPTRLCCRRAYRVFHCTSILKTCAPGLFRHICVLWVFPCTPVLKMCTLGVSLHNYLEDVYSGRFPAHLSERCVLWVFHCISVHKDMYTGYFAAHLYFPTHQSETCIYWVFPCKSILKMYTLGVSMLIYLIDVYSGYFRTQDVPSGHFYFHIYHNRVPTGY